MKLKLPKKLSRARLTVKRNWPTIATWTGIAFGVGGAIGVGFATAKTVRDVDAAHTEKERIESVEGNTVSITNQKTGEVIEMTKEEALANLKKSMILKIVRNFVLPSGAIVASIVFEVSGHRAATKTIAGLTSIAAISDAKLKNLSKNIIDTYGEDAYYELLNAPVRYEVTELNENGEETKYTVEELKHDPTTVYSRVFDETCPGWYKDPHLTREFLLDQQKWANIILAERGYLFLNDVYEMLGFQKTAEGGILGWSYNGHPGDPITVVDFGLEDVSNQQVRRFINGLEKTVLLDFKGMTNILNDFPKEDDYHYEHN